MDTQQKAYLISFVIVAASLATTVALYVFFKISFLFIIFVPPVVYKLLKKSGGNNPADGSPDG